jgi:type II secretory pathway component PulF
MMYEEELDTVLTSTSKLIEPLMIIFIWFVVVAIALSVFGVIGNILWSVWV